MDKEKLNAVLEPLIDRTLELLVEHGLLKKEVLDELLGGANNGRHTEEDSISTH